MGTKNNDGELPEANIPSRSVAIRNPYATGRGTSGTYKPVANNNDNNAASNHSSNNGGNSTEFAAEKKAATSTTEVPAAAPSLNKENRPQPNELAYWERLPSRNVSFTPAEILTVTECLNDEIAKLYCEQGHSVRITGILERRCINDDNKIELQVKDPKSTSTAAIAKKLAEPKRRKSASFQRRSLSSKKRPWFVTLNKASPAPKQGKNTLKIIVDPGDHLSKAIVGSCVTAIGELVVSEQLNYDLVARTLSVGPTTNITLYEQALELRRRTIYERYHYNNIPTTPKTLLQGCGPPPYEALNRSIGIAGKNR